MKCFNKLILMWLALVAFAMSAHGQPCVNGIITNPHNPVNNQFVPLANQWYPSNGTDTHNPWLNQWSWYWSDGNPTIYRDNLNWNHQWPGNAPSVAMVHPYDILMPEGFEYLRPAGVHPDLYDYRWEDGWELLWMNLGYYPDGHPINDPAPGSYYANHNWTYEPLPSNAPYFAIYNRYRGLLRLFANVWYSAESTFDNIDVVLRFTTFSGDQNKLTGILRHASAYDRALSEPTEISAIHAPRFHAPDLTQWIVADFQMGYDPCSCNSTGELILDFDAFSTLNVDIIGRSIGLEVPINDTTYTTRDFLNMSAVNIGDYAPGTEIYQNMDRLAEAYRKRQTKYAEDMKNYNQALAEFNHWAPLRFALEMVGIREVGQYIASGITNITLTDSLYTWINIESPFGFDEFELPQILGALPPSSPLQLPMPMTQVQELDTVIVRAFSDKAKKEIGRVFGNLATEIFKSSAPGKPTPPTVPVATLEESVYKGTITNVDTRASAPLIMPGSLPHAWAPATPLSPHRLPVYNEILGVSALLETPSPLYYMSGSVEPLGNAPYTTYLNRMTLKLRFDDALQFTLNGALDIDYDKSQTYVGIELRTSRVRHLPEWETNVSVGLPNSNFSLDHAVIDGNETVYTFMTKWVPIEELNQITFALNVVDTITGNLTNLPFPGLDNGAWYSYKLKSLKLKVIHDYILIKLAHRLKTSMYSMFPLSFFRPLRKWKFLSI